MTDRLEKNARIKQTTSETKLRRGHQRPFTVDLKVDESHLSVKQRDQIDGLFLEGKRFINTVLNFVEEGGNPKDFSGQKCTEAIIKDKDGTFRTEPFKYIKTSQRDALLDNIKTAMKAMYSLRVHGYQKNNGKLRYKSQCTMIPFKQFGNTHKIQSVNKLKLQGIKGTIRVRGLEKYYGREDIEYTVAKLCKLADGLHIFLTIFIDKVVADGQLQENKPSIGVDFGCTHTLNLSNGETIDVKVEESERTIREQKNLSRKKKGSNNYHKNRHRLQKAYLKNTRRKKDKANKIIHELRKHKLVVFQDEQLKNWKRNGHGKAVQHSAMGRIKAMLKVSPNTVMLDKLIPTTKLCPICGHTHDVSRFDKTVTCCGITEQRDIHAAKTMLWIVETLCKPLFVLPGRKDIKRVEFVEMLEAYVSNHDQTLKHEAAQSLAAL